MKKESQDQQVLKHLLSGKRISTWTAIKFYNHTRLSRSINTLRKKYPIQDEWAEYGDKKFKLYFLSQEFLSKLSYETNKIYNQERKV